MPGPLHRQGYDAALREPREDVHGIGRRRDRQLSGLLRSPGCSAQPQKRNAIGGHDCIAWSGVSAKGGLVFRSDYVSAQRLEGAAGGRRLAQHDHPSHAVPMTPARLRASAQHPLRLGSVTLCRNTRRARGTCDLRSARAHDGDAQEPKGPFQQREETGILWYMAGVSPRQSGIAGVSIYILERTAIRRVARIRPSSRSSARRASFPRQPCSSARRRV